MNDLLSIQNQLTVLAEEGTSLDALGGQLGALWDEAEASGNNTAIERLQAIWDQAQALDNHRQHLAGVAQAAVEVANEMIQQRDQIADSLGDVVQERDAIQEGFEAYRDQVRGMDYDNPDVQQLVDEVEAMAFEYITNEGICTNEPGEDIVGTERFPSLMVDDAEAFAMILFGYSSELPGELYAQIATFITDIMKPANAHWTAERERRMAEHHAFLAQRKEQASS